jgi:hypothetical protein
VANKAVRRARRYVPHLSNYHEALGCTKQVEITLADPVFDPQDQSGRKILLVPRAADFSHRYGIIFVRTRCSDDIRALFGAAN